MHDLYDIALTRVPEWEQKLARCDNCRRKDEALRAAKEFVAGCDGACDCQYREGGPCDWCKLTALITTALEET